MLRKLRLRQKKWFSYKKRVCCYNDDLNKLIHQGLHLQKWQNKVFIK